MPLRVRACVCGRGERDRDIREAREAVELGRRQSRELVAVKIEGTVGNTHERRACARGQCVRVCVHASGISLRG